MVGREAYRNPWLFATADTAFYGQARDALGDRSREDVLETYLEYVEIAQRNGG